MKDYQTLFVGVVGFAGVIITLLVNARQARKQRLEERCHERKTLRAALVEELKINKESIQMNLKHLKELEETKEVLIPIFPMNDIYESTKNRIGLLSKDEVKKVIFAHLTQRQRLTNLLFIGTRSDEFPQQVRIPRHKLGQLCEMDTNLLSVIDDALEAIHQSPKSYQTAMKTWKIWTIWTKCRGLRLP